MIVKAINLCETLESKLTDVVKCSITFSRSKNFSQRKKKNWKTFTYRNKSEIKSISINFSSQLLTSPKNNYYFSIIFQLQHQTEPHERLKSK